MLFYGGFSGNESFKPERFEFVLEHKPKMKEALQEFEAYRVVRPFERRVAKNKSKAPQGLVPLLQCAPWLGCLVLEELCYLHLPD